jgi:hypothetical protein
VRREAGIEDLSELPGEPVLRFTPYAWAKLQFFCHAGDTEIGGFGLAATDDPLLVTDLLTVRQSVSSASVEFDDVAVAELFEDQVDAGHRPDRFARLWCHTHPGHSPDPSGTDEETFDRVFGSCEWALMFILARGGRTYARLRFNAGPGGDLEIPVAIDYHTPFPGADHEAWANEYDAHVHPETLALPAASGDVSQNGMFDGTEDVWPDDTDWELFKAAADQDPSEMAEFPDDFEVDHDLLESLMDEYGVNDTAELRTLLQHEDLALFDAGG